MNRNSRHMCFGESVAMIRGRRNGTATTQWAVCEARPGDRNRRRLIEASSSMTDKVILQSKLIIDPIGPLLSSWLVDWFWMMSIWFVLIENVG